MFWLEWIFGIELSWNSNQVLPGKNHLIRHSCRANPSWAKKLLSIYNFSLKFHWVCNWILLRFFKFLPVQHFYAQPQLSLSNFNLHIFKAFFHEHKNISSWNQTPPNSFSSVSGLCTQQLRKENFYREAKISFQPHVSTRD